MYSCEIIRHTLPFKHNVYSTTSLAVVTASLPLASLTASNPASLLPYAVVQLARNKKLTQTKNLLDIPNRLYASRNHRQLKHMRVERYSLRF